MKLLIRIKINREIKIIILEYEYEIKILNSLKTKLKIINHIIINREGINQNW